MLEEDLMKLCKDLCNTKTRAINWTGGGEPTINKSLGKAIEYIHQNSHIKQGIFTNGCLLDRNNLIDILIKNMTWIRISIDAGNAETYNRIRRVAPKFGWQKMEENLFELLERREIHKMYPDIGVGFVITPDNYETIIDFANYFQHIDVDYCQFKPEIVNVEREEGIQREASFWIEKVEPLLEEAKNILGDKFKINGYKLTDLKEDPEILGRNYKKCFGSQLQPCIGADGEVYVCTNLRGYKEYSYGNIKERSFQEIWADINKRKHCMNRIENVEKFKNCTQLCKPHQSNKLIYKIYDSLNTVKHPEFI